MLAAGVGTVTAVCVEWCQSRLGKRLIDCPLSWERVWGLPSKRKKDGGEKMEWRARAVLCCAVLCCDAMQVMLAGGRSGVSR